MAPKSPQLTPQTLAVLEAMLQDTSSQWYGWELCKEAGLKSGTVYPVLIRLERAGWLESEWEDIDPAVEGRPRRRLYRLSGTGERAARVEVDRLLTQLERVRASAWSRKRLREQPS